MDTSKRPAFVPTFPRTLYLEATNRCDSECQTCIRTFNTLEPPKDLTLAEVQRIVAPFPVLERVVGRKDDVIVTPDGRQIGRLSPGLKGFPVREAQ